MTSPARASDIIMGQTLLEKSTKHHFEKFEVWKRGQKFRDEAMLADNKAFRTCAYCLAGSSVKLLLLKVCWVYEPGAVAGLEEQFQKCLQALDPGLHQNLLPWGRFESYNEFVLAGRQYTEFTIESRLRSEPALRPDEKAFICTQLLVALLAVHQRDRYHNAIKASNCLLTSDCRLLLADFAFYKPLYIIESDLASLRTFYSSSMESCTLAPEKIAKDQPERLATELASAQAMDVFSMGCVLYELFNNHPAFNYESLCRYRNEPTPIQNEFLARHPIIQQAFERKAGDRPTAKQLLLGWLEQCGEGEQQLFVWYVCGGLRMLDSATADCKVGLLALLLARL